MNIQKMLLENQHHRSNTCIFYLPDLPDYTCWGLWWRVVKPALEEGRFPMSLPPFLFLVNVLTTPPQNCWSLTSNLLWASGPGELGQALRQRSAGLWKQSWITLWWTIQDHMFSELPLWWLAVWKRSVFEGLIPEFHSSACQFEDSFPCPLCVFCPRLWCCTHFWFLDSEWKCLVHFLSLS